MIFTGVYRRWTTAASIRPSIDPGMIDVGEDQPYIEVSREQLDGSIGIRGLIDFKVFVFELVRNIQQDQHLTTMKTQILLVICVASSCLLRKAHPMDEP
jgi:hypothetical protein